jgi:hypothetical protein
VKVAIRPTTPADAGPLVQFLDRVFGTSRDASLLGEKYIEWKYWAARPDWPGSRSFIAEHNGAIVAHAAAWPVRVHVGSSVVQATHVVDWAAHPDYPGAGIWLMRQVRS